MEKLPLGIQLFETLKLSRPSKELIYKCSVLFLTYISFASYHMARKPLSIVKNSEQFVNCSRSVCSSWVTELEGKSEDEAKTSLGLLDTTYLVSFALFMFLSGPVAERVDLRLFLSLGMLGSGIFSSLIGLAYGARIHSIWYFIAMQILSGLFQTTGWPGVLSIVANWFGKGRRGLIMGAWYSHTFIGNILGAIVAGIFADDNWGLSFIIPGIIMILIGVLLFLFLVPDPSMVGLSPLVYASEYHWDSASPSSASSSTSITQFPSRRSSPALLKIENGKSCSDLLLSDSESEPLLLHEDQAIGFWGALKIPGVVEYSLCLFFAKLVVYTFMFWLPNYINDTSSLDASSSANLSTVFDVGGILGAVLAGLISDWSGMSATTCTVMFLSSVPSMILYQYLQAGLCPLSQIDGAPIFNTCYALNVALLILTGLLVNGPFALILTVVSADLGTHQSLRGSKKALATVSAIIEGTASVGAAVGPSLAGWLADDGEWGNVFSMMVVADAAAASMLARIVVQEIRNRSR